MMNPITTTFSTAVRSLRLKTRLQMQKGDLRRLKNRPLRGPSRSFSRAFTRRELKCDCPATWLCRTTALLTLAGALLALSPCSALAASESTGFQIDPAHTGASDAPNIVYPLTQKWSITLPGSVSYPLIADGMVFVTVYDTTVGEAKLYALNETTGAIAWGPLALGSEWASVNATYDNGTVFVNDTGIIQAFNAQTGALKWTTPPLPNQYFFTAPPTAATGTVYLTGAGDGGTAYALNETDGALRWYENIDAASGVAVGPDGLYLSPTGSEALKLDAANGSVIWHDPANDFGPYGSIGAYYGGDFFLRQPFGISSPDGVEDDAATGAFVASFAAGPAPAFDKGLAFFLNGNTLSGNKISTQAQLWSVTGSTTDPFVTAPIVAGGAVIEGTKSGNLTAYNETKGSIVWTTSVGAALSAPNEFANNQPLTGLAAAGGLVVVPAAGTLAAYGSASSDISADVSVASSALKLSAGKWVGTITITNTSSGKLLGPLDLVLNNLSGAQLVNSAGTLNNAPYLLVPADSLARGGTATVQAEFNGPSPTYSASTYSGIL